MRILGIPIEINVSWLITLALVTWTLAIRIYPELLPRTSPYREDYVLHWVMAVCSGLAFFTSIVLHELAPSIVAKRQGIEVKAITLFVFGGVSQIGGEARRPLYEFFIAIVGMVTVYSLGLNITSTFSPFSGWMVSLARVPRPVESVMLIGLPPA